MKKFGMLLVSVVLALCMAIGMTACGNNRGNGDNGGGEGNKPETPATPAITTDVSSLSLVKNEKVNVTATVANSDKSASFSLSAGSEDVVALSVSESTPNVATVTALNDGNATLTVALEGATSVSVPVTVDGIVAIVGDIIDQTKEFDAGETGKDDGETTTFTVKHFMGDDCKVEVTNGNDAVAELSESNGTYSLKALQAGVSEITVTLSAVKEETPDEGEETPEPDAQSDDEETTPEYEEIYTNTLGFVCTDDWDKAAKADEISSKILNFKEVSGGYAAYIDATDVDDEFINFDLGEYDGKLYVPAVYNRKPVVTLAPSQVRNFGQLEAYFLAFREDMTGDDLDDYKAIYAAVSELYLPCTLTEIPTLAFRLATVEKIEVQKGNHIASIGVQAFNQANALTSFNMEDCRELKTIYHDAFANGGNADLSLIIPNSVESIEKLAFTGAILKKVEFEKAKVDDSGNYVSSVTFETLGPNAASGVFHGAQIETIVLRNIKNFYGVQKDENGNPEKYNALQPDGTFVEAIATGGDYVAQSAAIKSLVIGEEVLQSQIQNGAYWIFAFLFTNGSTATLTLEGANNDIAQKVAEWAGVDNCGCLFGFSAFLSINPIKVYIHKDIVENGKVGSLITTRYNQNTDYQDEIYTEWTVKA